MSVLRSLRLNCRSFGADTRGSIPTEGVMAFTFLIWWYIASFQFFDAYRQKNINLKGAYTVADLLSRETGPVAGDPNSVEVNQAYIDGLNTMFDYMTYSNKPTWIRVTSVFWDEDTNKYVAEWSRTSGSGHPVMTTAMLANYDDRIPVLPTGDSVVLVETFMAYEPIFSMGLDARWFETFIATSPRFASCLPWESNGCGTDSDADGDPDITDIPFDPDTFGDGAGGSAPSD